MLDCLAHSLVAVSTTLSWLDQLLFRNMIFTGKPFTIYFCKWFQVSLIFYTFLQVLAKMQFRWWWHLPNSVHIMSLHMFYIYAVVREAVCIVLWIYFSIWAWIIHCYCSICSMQDILTCNRSHFVKVQFSVKEAMFRNLMGIVSCIAESFEML